MTPYYYRCEGRVWANNLTEATGKLRGMFETGAYVTLWDESVVLRDQCYTFKITPISRKPSAKAAGANKPTRRKKKGKQ